MNLSEQRTTKTRQITLAAVFAIVYFILRSVPTFSMIELSGQFTAGDFLLTTIALVAGVWSGTIAVLVGTIIAYPVRPPIFFGLDFLPGVVNVFVAALLISGRRRIAQAVYVLILAAFLVSPYSVFYGYDHVPYVWLHLIALIVLLSPAASRIPVVEQGWIFRSCRHCNPSFCGHHGATPCGWNIVRNRSGVRGRSFTR